MRKAIMKILAGVVLLMLPACGKTDISEETPTEAPAEVIISRKTEDATDPFTELPSSEDFSVISEGSGGDTEEMTEDPADALEGIAFNRKRKLPNIVEPLDDARGFNPRIINADLFEAGEYWRKELGTEIYMMLEYGNINEDPSELEILDRRADDHTVRFGAVLRFERHDDMNIEICYYGDQSYIVHGTDDKDYTSQDNMPRHSKDGDSEEDAE